MMLLGVDGGASRVRVQAVTPLEGGRLGPAGPGAQATWGRPFTPPPLGRQLEEHRTGRVVVEGEEAAAGRQRLATLADLVAAVAADPPQPLVLGLCMPGLATPDGRGVAVARNGPRMPHLLDDLEAELAARGLALARAPRAPRLVPDGDAAGWGEEHGEGGAFAPVASAYYVGCGTGVAEALKLAGRCVPMASVRHRLPAPWAMELGPGRWVEDALSMAGLEAEFARRGAEADLPIGEAARAGSAVARQVLTGSAQALGHFLLARLEALWAWEERTVERIVVGQRSAQLLARPDLAPWYRQPLEATLADGGRSPRLVRVSRLAAAPAIGALAATLGLVGGERGTGPG